MDISVSHLNNRLSLQLPQELPLGLVFVTGTVSFSDSAVFTELVAHGRYKHIHFELLDSKHRIRCVLVVRAMVDFDLELGVRVRVGGHLRFDLQRADYYLLARDLERLDEDVFGDVEDIEADQEEIAALLADIRKRTSKQDIPSDLPQWVQELAPESLQDKDRVIDLEEPALDGVLNEGETAVSEEASTHESEAALVSSISALLDQMDDVELTPDMIQSLDEQEVLTQRESVSKEPDAEESTVELEQNGSEALTVEEQKAKMLVRNQKTNASTVEQDWLVWLLIAFIIILVLIVAGVLLF